MGKTAMDKKSYLRQVPRIDLDKYLFPDTLFETLPKTRADIELCPFILITTHSHVSQYNVSFRIGRIHHGSLACLWCL